MFPHNQLRCPKCGATKSQFISFKAEGHLITDALHQYTCDLLARGTYTNKQVAEITGLGENTVKEIDKKRLQSIYTTFQEAFEEKCYWIQPVFDYFHIVKNFNDKVVSEVRKDEQKRLYEEGNVEAAKALKKTRYILMSKRSTLQKKDADGNGR